MRQRLSLDFVIVNGENAASGFGITDKICRQLFEAGADVITGGNHSWDQREVMSYIAGEPRLLRPHNFTAGTPGRGSGVFETRSEGRRVGKEGARTCGSRWTPFHEKQKTKELA